MKWWLLITVESQGSTVIYNNTFVIRSNVAVYFRFRKSIANKIDLLFSLAKPQLLQVSKFGNGQSVQKTIGSTIKFKCVVGGQPKPTVVWHHNGTPMIDADSRGSRKGRGTLIISDLKTGGKQDLARGEPWSSQMFSGPNFPWNFLPASLLY